jgi:acyl carrier protein
MAQLNLVLELEDAFDISLEPEEIGEMTTFERVCKVLKEKLTIRS